MDNRITYTRALETYGAHAQIMMVFEETAELQKELCKNMRGADNRDHIAEEIADVLIMLDQMMLLYDNEERVTEYKAEKVERLRARLDAYDAAVMSR